MKNQFLTDLSIFTNNNENGIKLSDRLNNILSNSKYFDVLVGYFRITGFYLLTEKLEDVEEIRILVGMGTDNITKNSVNIFEVSGAKATENVKSLIVEEFNQSKDDNLEMEKGILKFCEWIASGKLKIRMCYERNVHAKIYIVRKNPEIIPDQFGNLITGSSNFSYNGLDKNVEFNVELKNKADVEYALEFYEELWKSSKDITFEIVDTIKKDTWINEEITPYELYLKTIFTYFEEEIQSYSTKYEWPDGYMHLKYQEDAVTQARKILARHGGVLISDVVGLGKTYIAAMLGKLETGRKLFLVPPVVRESWEAVLAEFGYKMSDKVVSLGIVDQVCEWDDLGSYDYVFVDEAHRFRNSASTEFKALKKICYGKKVVLITATPQNNTILDIASLITLFQDSRVSSIIPSKPNLENYFSYLKTKLSKSKGTDEYNNIISEVAADLRDNVLRHILIRRTRSEIQKYYKDDLDSQGLIFPKLENPKPLTYMYDDEMEKAFNHTIELLKKFTYARYTPLLFLKNKKLIGSNKARQENMKGFIKTMLIKRLESSIFAFNESIVRLKKSSSGFIELYNNGKVVVGAASKSKKYGYEELTGMTDEQFENIIEMDDIDCYKVSDFTSDLYDKVLLDDVILDELCELWTNFNAKVNDVKYDVLKKKIDTIKSDKIIIFTEAKDTVDYLLDRLKNDYNNTVISYTGSDNNNKKQYIKENFDPKFDYKNVNDKRILVATDALSEGINLHKASVLINYDLPWNPTRIMQRVGRINRVGSKNEELFVYNFFPSANTREHLSLEESIKNKIQMFHELLGEDSKFIADDEKVESYELYDFMMMANKLPDEESLSINSLQMSFLQLIDSIKKNNKNLFDSINDLPNKIRVARPSDKSRMITFIKKGLIKKFVLQEDGKVLNIEFEDAMKLIHASETDPSTVLRNDYYDRLNESIKYFDASMISSSVQNIGTKDSPNEKKVKKYIRFLGKENTLTDEDKFFIKKVEKAVNRGSLNSRIFKDIISEIDNSSNIQFILDVFKKNIDDLYLEERKNYGVIDSFKETSVVVLSEYFVEEK